MPFGSKEIGDATKLLSDKTTDLAKHTEGLTDNTAYLAEYTKGLSDTTVSLTEQTKGLKESTGQLQKTMVDFGGQMQDMTQQMHGLQGSIDRMGDTLAEQLSTLNKTLQSFGKTMTQSMVDNVKDNLSIRKILPGFLKGNE